MVRSHHEETPVASPVVDVHTHCLTHAWFELLQKHGGPRYTVREVSGGLRAIHLDGAPFMTPVPAMFDYDLRIATMDRHGVDIGVLSLTCPNCYWGGPDVSLRAARIMNDDMAAAATAHPDRLRWFASLPWQYAKRALDELARAREAGACGVMVLANIDGRPLTDAAFAPIWSAIDKLALPVLVHPTAPPGVGEMDMARFQLTASIGFTFDTSLAIARMVYDGFFDRYANLKIIASHGGGALPYLISRMDQCYDNIPACREKIAVRPSEYLPKIYADAVVFSPEVLELCVKTFGSANVIYGSDYPHTIGDMPGCLARVNGLPGAAREAVRGANALRIFGF
jgi:aminocarboxymuconate-semialdehyde decarboxylase